MKKRPQLLALAALLLFIAVLGRIGAKSVRPSHPVTGAVIATTRDALEDQTFVGTLRAIKHAKRGTDKATFVLTLETPDGYDVTVYLGPDVQAPPAQFGRRYRVTGNVADAGMVMVDRPDGLQQLKPEPTTYDPGPIPIRNGWAYVELGNQTARIPASEFADGTHTDLELVIDEKGVAWLREKKPDETAQ